MNSKGFSFNKHDGLRGTHALFSPSQSAWLRYDEEKIIDRVRSQFRAPLGSEIHEYAAMQINLSHKKSNLRTIEQEIENYIFTKYSCLNDSDGISDYGQILINHMGYLPKEVFETVKYYINDGIGFKMVTEQPLVYSDHIYGTADSIIFRDGLLRIHDLKTGSHEAKMEQLETYAALFCLEYDIKPAEIQYELRLYQIDGLVIHTPTVEDLLPIVDAIVTTEKIAYNVEKGDK